MEPINILNRASKLAESAEVFSSRTTSLSVSFENNLIKDSSSSDLSGSGVRVIRDGRIGFSSTNRPGDEAVADRACELALHGRKALFDFPADPKVAPAVNDISQLDSLDEAASVKHCEEAVEKLKGLGDGVMAFSGMGKTLSTSRIVNTAGLDMEQQLGFLSWYSGLVLNTEGNFIQIYGSDYGDCFKGFDKQVAEVSEAFALCATNENVPTGKYRVLLSPRGLLNFMGVFTACLNGMSVAKGISPWTGKQGSQLFDPRFTLLTDLVSDDSPYRMAVDNEGVPTGRRMLINEGVLESFYHSLNSAAQCGHEPTGHGSRGPASLPSPSMNCPRILPGNTCMDDMFKDAEIWIDELIGAIMSNPYGGIISGTVALGFTMRNGKRVARVKDAMLSLNVFEIFKGGILAVSRETRREGAAILPWILLDGVSIASR